MNLNYRFGLPLIMTFCALSPLSAQRPETLRAPCFRRLSLPFPAA